MPSVDANLTIDDNGTARPLRVSDLAIQGKSVRHGAGAPTDASGTFDEFYIDTAAWAIYGPKTDAGWGAATSLIGSVDLAPFQARSEKGQPNGYAGLDAGGKVATSVLPALAINDVFPVADQAAMLALTAQRGDIAVRADNNKTYALAGDDATLLANWIELKTPGAVTSINGQTGAVVLRRLVAGGNLGATPSLAMQASDHDVWLVGTLNANATLTVTGLAAGQSARLLLTQDATGGRTLSITVGGSTAAVSVNATAGASSVVSCFCDGTDLYVRGA
jgi:hypothetical protein